MLETLTYSYELSENEEPIAGERLVTITISDGISESSVTITVDVQPLNNHPPAIVFAGSSNISFTEGETTPNTLGALLSLRVTDPDNNTLFLMQSATVELVSALDGNHEELNIDVEAAHALGIVVERKLKHMLRCTH